jgi:hypothetical protein
MSRGPGKIEMRIADLFAATRDRALSIDTITDHAFALTGNSPTRVQRLSATRAAHRVLRRVRENHERSDKVIDQAHANTKAALGREQSGYPDKEYDAKLKADPAFIEGHKLHDACNRIGMWSRIVHIEGKPGWLRAEFDHWCATTINGRLYFHPPDVPVRVWAVSIGPGGITWAEAKVTKVTERNVMVRYAKEPARLDREKLWRWWVFWRGVPFVSSRTGRIAAELDKLWHRRYGTTGTTPPSMQMPLADAIALLGVKADYTKADVLAAFRRKAKAAHPDAGGTAEIFRKLVEARDRLLAALGTKAPPPKPPRYAPKGMTVTYRRGSSGSTRQQRIGSTRLLSGCGDGY